MTIKDVFSDFLEMTAENLANIVVIVLSALGKVIYISFFLKRDYSTEKRIASFVLAVIVGSVAGSISDRYFSSGVSRAIISVATIASDSIMEYIITRVTAKEIDKKVDKITDKILK